MTTEVEIKQDDFFANFRSIVDEGSVSIFSSPFEVFSSSGNEYKGEVSYDRFKVRRKRKFFDTNKNFAVAKGTLRQEREKLIIETEINGFSETMIPFYLFVLIFYTFFIGSILRTNKLGNNESGFTIGFILLHAALMIGLPYLLMRRGVKRLMHDLEREFFYTTRKSYR